jgi:hypothetical protein
VACRGGRAVGRTKKEKGEKEKEGGEKEEKEKGFRRIRRSPRKN